MIGKPSSYRQFSKIKDDFQKRLFRDKSQNASHVQQQPGGGDDEPDGGGGGDQPAGGGPAHRER
jgi:hypothetical protein